MEFRSLSVNEMQLYAHQMERVKLRINEAATLMRDRKDERALVYSAAQLRLAIEEVVFSSLVSNQRALAEAQASLDANRDMGGTRKLVSRVNPEYWPRGVTQVTKVDGVTEWLNRDDGLSKKKYPQAWGRLSRLLHARNPFLAPLNLKEEGKLIERLIGQLRATLNEHIIKMADVDELLNCQVGNDPVRVHGFGRVSD